MNEQAIRSRYIGLVSTAAVAAVFAVIVCVVLLLTFAYRVPDPLSTPQYLALKEALSERPDSDPLKEEIRALDLALRDDFFQRQRFTAFGAYLLVGAVAIALVAAKTATTVHRRLPEPTAPDSSQDPDARLSRQSLWGVAALTLLLLTVTVGMAVSHLSVLPHNLEDLAERIESERKAVALPNGESEPREVEVVDDTEPSAIQPDTVTTQLPSQEEFLRNWPRFRGPDGAGISATSEMPTAWDGAAGEGIVWKTPVPLPGKNSPVIWEDHLFLTGASEERREVYCFATESGELRWQKALPETEVEGEPMEVSEDTGFAAPTAVTDGVRVYAIFANGDLAAFDFEGNQVWFQSFGIPQNPYGHASSLTMHEHLLFVQLDQGTKDKQLSRVWALDSSTGSPVWEVKREVPSSWASPITLDHGGAVQLITCADPWVIAYEALTGFEIWRAKSLRQDVGPSPIRSGEMLYVANEFPGISAIRLGGTGDITESHVVWLAEFVAPDTCTPLIVGDLLLGLASYGTLACYDAAEGGDPLWEEDFDDNFKSSPGLAGDHVYLFGESGKCWIIQATREQCTTVAEAELGEECVTSPAFRDGRIYIRGKEHMFCLGEKN